MVSTVLAESLWDELSVYFQEQWNNLINSFRQVGMTRYAATVLIFIILGLCIGGAIAPLVSVLVRRKYGRFVRSLLHADANAPENAKTLAELGFAGKKRIIRGLKYNSSLRGVVTCSEEDEFYSQEPEQVEEKPKPKNPFVRFWYWFIGKDGGRRFDWKEVEQYHFYIPEKRNYLAGTRYDKNAERLLPAILALVGFAVLAGLLFRFLPNLLKYVVSVFTGSGS